MRRLRSFQLLWQPARRNSMAQFVRLWETRQKVIEELVAAAVEADRHREAEYRAAVTVQSWFRGCRVRAYLGYLHESAVVIQKNFRAYEGRKIFRQRMKERLEEMRRNHYHRMAQIIQRAWRGYFVRKYIFNYYAQKSYLEGLEKKNRIVRQRLELHWQKAVEERSQREEELHELQTEEEARKHHYMLSTQCVCSLSILEVVELSGQGMRPKELCALKLADGVFKSLPFERCMQTVKLVPSQRRRLHRPMKKRSLSCDTEAALGGERGQGGKGEGLPPVMPKVQGPFRPQHEVWRQRTKPLSPTLRVATSFTSEEIARAELKRQEWRSRVIDEPFLPFSRRHHGYEPLLHTQSSYNRPLYGTRWFRDEDASRDISLKAFQTVVPAIPIFEKLNSTY